MRTATGTSPVSTTSDRIAVGSVLVSVITRKVLTPHAVLPSATTAPTTSTAAATMSSRADRGAAARGERRRRGRPVRVVGERRWSR